MTTGWIDKAGKAALLLVSCALTLFAAEFVVRAVDGLPLATDWLPDTVDRDASISIMKTIARAPHVSPDWFRSDPPPLPNRHAPPREWTEAYRAFPAVPDLATHTFRPAELYKAWNAVAVGPPCRNTFLRQAPHWVYLYQPADNDRYPLYRFLPHATTPLGLVTNQLGWRGPPTTVEKPPATIRIVFVGASTTVNSHYYPFSYPEFVGHWLNLWAAERGLDVRFETLNAGREGLMSTDIAAVIRKEVLPLAPDLVVYYEGANQFILSKMLKDAPSSAPAATPPGTSEGPLAAALRDVAHRSALARRLRAAIGRVRRPGGEELPKPDYQMTWPAGLSESEPDLTRTDLPINLSTILPDLESNRATLEAAGSELAVSSFKWIVHDGLVLDPVRHQALWQHLNLGKWPFTYRDLARMAAFQNRVLARYATQHGLPFIDIAGQTPDNPDLATDAIHFSYGGVRLHAWIALQSLVPLIERRIAAHVWPTRPKAEPAAPPGLFFQPQIYSLDDCSDRGGHLTK
ncbi:MAG: hypothetical protein J0J01_21945 [Reyranella sp.]|uniref:hypothetical protein n=1 Tax=Reyranella sp. TaxID=1929291 RepID=UPI001ACDEA22|nr:hypothetical protein [Reyranella sp.]MBN9089584.1 hypothetical protein [Reyranella sp.]